MFEYGPIGCHLIVRQDSRIVRQGLLPCLDAQLIKDPPMPIISAVRHTQMNH
jgi:hypothetical protein